MKRLVILTEIISPYRIPLFNALARSTTINPHVIFLAETDPNLRQWLVYKEEIRFPHEILPSWRKRVGKFNVLLNRGVGRALGAASPDAILCGGYSYLASWLALFWARSRKIPFLLWSESNLHDARRGYAPVEMLKTTFLRECHGFVVPGKSALEYLHAHRVKEDSIFVAPNAVDNELFSAAAAIAQQNEGETRRRLDLPGRYFLFVGRLVREKGVFELLSAYAKLSETLRREVGLMFVGDGPCRPELERQATSTVSGQIKFTGFTHRDQLAKYYALAEVLVLPTHTDTWGLVVNEAMACGLPIILSRVAGCASDLVQDMENGLLVPPKDAAALAEAMTTLVTRPDLCARMRVKSADRIASYTAAEWSNAIGRAIQFVTGTRD